MIRPVVACVALVALAGLSHADIIVEVLPSISPNGNSSPSYEGYAGNAVTGISGSGAATGDPGLPTYYSSIPNGGVVSITNLIATDFPYWKGTVNPAAPFAGEFGNLLTFGARLTTTAGQFSLSNVRYSVSDTFDAALETTGDFVTENYTSRRVGVIYNASGPPTLVTSGSGNQLVDELWLVGVGVGYELLAEEFTGGVPNQGELASLLSGFPSFQVTGRFTAETPEGTFTGEATVNIDPTVPTPAVPAPPAVILAGVGMAAVAIRRRRGAWVRPRTCDPDSRRTRTASPTRNGSVRDGS